VKENPQSIEDEPKVTNINFEMTKSALDTVLEGLWQIRDQLSSLTLSSSSSSSSSSNNTTTSKPSSQ
jgi:hypothetical protein